jgi:cell division septation protein DedD
MLGAVLMRDTHRMREKYDLSLDSRQVVSLLVGAIVVLGAVFVLGVLVGKKLAGTQHPDRGPDPLAALDHRSDALEKARATPPLTFQEELTRTTPDDKHLPAPAKPPAVKPVPAATAAVATTVKSPAAPSAVAPAKPPAPAPAVASAPKAAPTPGVPAAAAGQESAHSAEGVTEAKAPAPETLTARTTPAAAKPVAPKPPDATVSNGAFTLQLGASPNRDDAERQASRLREKGYAPYIVAAEVPGKGTWYRVRMGSFPTKDAATRYLQDFKRETQSEAFVASTK